LFGPDIEAYKKLLQRRMEWRELTEEGKAAEMLQLHLPSFWQIVPYLVVEARRIAQTCAMSYRKFVWDALFMPSIQNPIT